MHRPNKINRTLRGKHNETRPYNLTQQNKLIDSLKETYKYLGYQQKHNR